MATFDKYKDMHDIFLTLAWTGISLGELLALKWDNVNLEQGKIRIIAMHVNLL